MASHFPQSFYGFILLSFAAFLIGCDSGPNSAYVSGVITVDGNAQEGVVVTFSPKSGERSSLGFTDAKGRYYLRFTQDKSGCIPGTHQVSIVAYKDPDNEYSQYLPTIYNDKSYDNPELNNVEVKKGKQTINFGVKTTDN